MTNKQRNDALGKQSLKQLLPLSDLKAWQILAYMDYDPKKDRDNDEGHRQGDYDFGPDLDSLSLVFEESQ